jgi:hypothetical protein
MVLGALGNVFSASHACGFALFNVNGSNGTYIGRQKGAVTEAEGWPGEVEAVPNARQLLVIRACIRIWGGGDGKGAHGSRDFSENLTVAVGGPQCKILFHRWI